MEDNDTHMDDRLSQLLTKPDLRILTVVRDHMSGLLYAVPYLRALRQQYPQATISLLANPYASPILEGCPYVDHIIPFFQFHQVGGRFSQLNSLTKKAKAWGKLVGRVDLVLHFRYVGAEMVTFCSGLGRPFQIGYTQDHSSNQLNIDLGFENEELDSRSRNARLIQALGLPLPSTKMELWIAPNASEWVDKFLHAHGSSDDDKIIILHPGCHWGCNQWLPERWAALGNLLQERLGGHIIITGSSDEQNMVQQIAQAMTITPTVAAGQTTLPQLAGLINRAALVVSVDTAPTQICQALNIPAVILMGAGTMAWNGPLPGEPMIMLQKWNEADEGSLRCDFAAGACNGPLCRSRLTRISIENVWEAIEKVLPTNNEKTDHPQQDSHS